MKISTLASGLGLLAVAASAKKVAAQRRDSLLSALHPNGHELPTFQLPRRDEAKVEARAESDHRFLTDKTKKYAVNGTGLPDIDFDLGESYAGNIPIGHSKDENLFFWFFPTVNEEHKDTKEITIWFTGGPGCSSLVALFQENGPVLWEPGVNKPVKNPWSYHLLTNTIWVDQPVTVGYSQGNASRVKNEDDVARDFAGFWKNFVDAFDMQGYKIRIVAESYGGMYGPYVGSHFLDLNDKKYYDLTGLLLQDPLTFGNYLQTDIPALDFALQHSDFFPINDTYLETLKKFSDHCGYQKYLEKYVAFPPAGHQDLAAGLQRAKNGSIVSSKGCEDDLWYDITVAVTYLNPCFDVYEIGMLCPALFDPLVPTDPDTVSYFDRKDVKKALHAPPNKQWSECVNGVLRPDGSGPAGVHALPHVIDKTQNVIYAHGGLDWILPLNGHLLGIQNMTWGGKLGFQQAPSDPFFVPYYGQDEIDYPAPPFYAEALPAGSGVLGTTHTERGLTFVVTALAGHQGPEFSPAGSIRQLEKLLGRVKSLNGTEPFTFPPLRKIPQPKGGLGKGIVKIPSFAHGRV